MSNPLLQLRGSFNQKRNTSMPGPPSLPAKRSVRADEVRELRASLAEVKAYWDNATYTHKPLVAVRYKRVIPKSGRIRRLLSEEGSSSSNGTIVGARFEKKGSHRQHVITHCLSTAALESSIADLDKLADCIDAICGGSISTEELNRINKDKVNFDKYPLSRSAFSRLVVDVCNVEKFEINHPNAEITADSMVTLYKDTGINNTEFLRSIGIPELYLRTHDESTYLLTPDQYRLLYNEAPQLIAMTVVDINEIPADEVSHGNAEQHSHAFPAPANEPWIGVFDMPFNEDVYFSNWVESSLAIEPDLIRAEDYKHGTQVTSLIVDGPSLNPSLDDGCGRFRVRHVTVATGRKFSSFTVIREIENAVIKYPEVKVWNLSLGSFLEVPENFVSAEAAALDRIQTEHDVVFIVAGTNDTYRTGKMRIGAPADSINSLVVNSVRLDGTPCSYTRQGPVLQFFGKPDVCYYGGDCDQQLRVCSEPHKEDFVSGTSFAAPWIARKMAYLIHVVGLSREVAKALIIDASCGWSMNKNPYQLGYGIVPKRIEDIVTTTNNEIKFILSGTSDMFDTYTHNIPVPIYQGNHPYYTKATLCYFPHCERSQGVDYTSTELTLSIGRLNGEKIKPIDNNPQDIAGMHTYEEDARHFFRKWDNIKHVAEEIKERSRPRKAYETGLWGISLKTKERLDESHGEHMRFGLVVTLHAMDGVNRIDEFIQRCSFRTWIVNRIDIENQIDIFNAAEQEIEFE